MFLASVQHTGTHFMRRCFVNGVWKVDHAHFYTEHKAKICRATDIVIPLRHPVAVAISWQRRGKEGFVWEWRRMRWANSPLFFPLENPPWEALEELSDFEIVRRKDRVTNLGDYPERLAWEAGDIDIVKNYLGEQWDVCQRLLKSDPIASHYYG